MFGKLSLPRRSGFDQASCWATTSALPAVWTLRMTAAVSKIRRAHADRPSEERCPASRPSGRALPTPPRLRGTFPRRRNGVVGCGEFGDDPYPRRGGTLDGAPMPSRNSRRSPAEPPRSPAHARTDAFGHPGARRKEAGIVFGRSPPRASACVHTGFDASGGVATSVPHDIRSTGGFARTALELLRLRCACTLTAALLLTWRGVHAHAGAR